MPEATKATLVFVAMLLAKYREDQNAREYVVAAEIGVRTCSLLGDPLRDEAFAFLQREIEGLTGQPFVR